MVAYANGMGGGGSCAVTPDDAAAAVQLLPLLLPLCLPLLDEIAGIDDDDVDDKDGAFFIIFSEDLAFGWFVTSDGKSSSVTTPAGFRVNVAARDPSAVQPMVNRLGLLLLLVVSSLFVTVCCKDGNADAVILESSKFPCSE